MKDHITQLVVEAARATAVLGIIGLAILALVGYGG